MIQKSVQSIEITQLQKPIHIIRSIIIPENYNQLISYFMLSTIDRKVMMVQINHSSKDLIFKYVVKQVSYVVTAIWQQEKSGNLWLGCGNGDIYSMKPKAPNLLVQNFKYKQKEPNLEKSIILLYLTKQWLLTFDFSNTVSFRNPTSLNILKTYKFINYEICSSLTLLNPYNTHIISCIAFNTNTPPILFDCQTPQQFAETFNTNLAIYRQFEFQQGQIVCLADQVDLRDDEQTVIVGGVATKQNNYVVVYEVKQQKKVLYLQMIFKFEVKYQVLCISVKNGLAMISMFNQLFFLDIASLKKQMSIKKSDLAVTIGFILQRSSQSVKFMANKGFNYLLPQAQQERKLKLRVRTKKLNNTNR